MKRLLLTFAALAGVIIGGYAVSAGNGTVQAAGEEGCPFGRPAHYQINSGIYACGWAPEGHPHPEYFYQNRLKAAIDCTKAVYALGLSTSDTWPPVSQAWFGIYNGPGADGPTYCRYDGLDRGALHNMWCADWQTNGPGTGPGVNPAADLEECAKWARDAFFSGDYNPTQVGVAIKCDTLGVCAQTGDTNPLNAR